MENPSLEDIGVCLFLFSQYSVKNKEGQKSTNTAIKSGYRIDHLLKKGGCDQRHEDLSHCNIFATCGMKTTAPITTARSETMSTAAAERSFTTFTYG